MNIYQNKEMSALTEAFHNGELTQADYRSKRRALLEYMEQEANESKPASSSISKPMVMRTLFGTIVMIVLLGLTVLAVKHIS